MTEIEKLIYENEKLKNMVAELQTYTGCIISIHTRGGVLEEVIKLKEKMEYISHQNEERFDIINEYAVLTDSLITKIDELVKRLHVFEYPLTPEQSFSSKKEEVKSEPEVKPYYYTVSDSTCIENCKFNLRFHGFTIKIGSSACGECEYCKEIDYENDFVKCKLMPEGKEKVEPKKEEIKQKRDEFGIIGVTENIGVCKDCIYKEYSDKSRPCTHCRTKLGEDEYYISK